MDKKNAIKKYILEELCPDQGIELDHIDDDFPLIDEGVLDSLGILNVLSFLDEELDIDISGIDTSYENFETLNAILKSIPDG